MPTEDQDHKDVMALKKKVKKEQLAHAETQALLDRCKLLLDNVTRACERMDTQAIEQTAGAGRDFIVNNPL